MKNAVRCYRRYITNKNFKPSNFRRDLPYRTRNHGRRPLQPGPPTILIVAALPHRAFVGGGRVLHLSPHGMQIVRCRDYRKQQNQHTSQRQ